MVFRRFNGQLENLHDGEVVVFLFQHWMRRVAVLLTGRGVHDTSIESWKLKRGDAKGE